MKLSPKFRNYFLLVLLIAAGWILINSMFFLYEWVTIQYLRTTDPDTLNLSFNLKLILIASLIAGLIGGTLMVFELNRRVQLRPFFHFILSTVLFFGVIYFLITFGVNAFVFSAQTGKSVFDQEVLSRSFSNLADPFQTRNIFLWMIIVIGTMLILQINDRFGPGNLWNMIRGKYYRPLEEFRVFMFLDIKSSTTLGEKLGHKEFFLFLNDFYREITDPIINRLGEIYQYVGDEIVISWSKENAVRNNNCLQCFFDIQDTIREAGEKFNLKYGVQPEFKAGMHCGLVTTGEVGVIKRDLVFTGDVLNTSSRIQDMCNDLNAHFLVSREVLNLFAHLQEFRSRPLGEMMLRGKENKVELFSISRP